MGFWSRLFRIGKAEVNSAIDKLEDAEKVSMQIVRDLQAKLAEAIKAEAEVKAVVLGHRRQETESRAKATEWERKTNELLDRVEDGKLDEAKGNELATTAAQNFQNYHKQAEEYKVMADRGDQAVATLDEKIKNLRKQISETENRVQMLRARSKVADASEKINRALSNVDADGEMATIKRLEEKVNAKEMLAQAYAEIGDATATSEQEIDKVLNEGSGSSALDAIKAKRAAQAN